MKLYVVRHGQTDINLNNQINSINDEDLNETGISQALKLKEYIKDIDYDLIICSPLKRAIHTAEIININNKKIIIDERIIERNAGVFTKQSLDNIDSNDWWNTNPKRDYRDAETVSNVINRVNNFIDDIKKKYIDNNILIVTHGGVSKVIHAYFNGIPKDGVLERYKCDNCEIKTYEI